MGFIRFLICGILKGIDFLVPNFNPFVSFAKTYYLGGIFCLTQDCLEHSLDELGLKMFLITGPEILVNL